MPRAGLLLPKLPPLLLVLTLGAAYLRTLAPGLTWANDASDGGDLIAAAATGGVPHPTGYPLYLLLARLFQLLLPGPLAFRTNLMSAVAAVLAALLVYAVVVRSQEGRELRAQVSALAAGLAFGLAPLVWGQAVVTEVYTLQALLTALVLWLYARPSPVLYRDRRRLDLWRGLALGLALCNQVVTLLVIPAALALGSAEGRPEDGLRALRWDAGAFRRQLAGLGLALGLYLLIPLRAAGGPPVNWGHAVTPSRLWWLVSGGLYQGHYLQLDPAGAWQRLQAFAGIFLEQFGLPGLALGLAGLIVFGARSRLHLLTGWIALVSLGFALLYGSRDSYLYLIPLLVSFAIWIGLGTAGLAAAVPGRLPAAGLALCAAAVAFFALPPAAHLREVDASADRRAEAFGRAALAAAPENSIVFASGDRAVFTLWYFHYALGERPDLAVLAGDLLHFDWYQETLRTTYPSLAVPGPFPWPGTVALANPARPVCYITSPDPEDMTCAAQEPVP